MRAVVALGSRALLGPDESGTVLFERRQARAAATALATLAEKGGLVVTYGADFQLGLLVSASPARRAGPYPLDALEAESEGLVGYLLEEALSEILTPRSVVAMLTRVEVSAKDPAFSHRSFPIGPVFDEQTAGLLAATNGWLMLGDGDGRRRAVPSPDPLTILESRSIDILCTAGVVVACSGGGGIPMVRDRFGVHHGVEAVVEKDLSAAVLAREVDADVLFLLTDVDGVWTDFASPKARLVREATPASLRTLNLDPATMGAKAEAAARFAEWTGRDAYIGPLDAITGLLQGTSGTRVTGAGHGLRLGAPQVVSRGGPPVD